MKTISSDYIKEIKEQIRVINEALKRVQEAEKVQVTTSNTREYETSKKEATGLYDINKYHKIVELDFRDYHK